MNEIIFITKDIVLFFHEQLIQFYGGSFEIRDENLLDSALAQPEATFEGKYLHDTLYKMAAAYCYHLCNNHPFVDGNKRIAFVVMDTFLQRNNLEIIASEKEVYKTMIYVASGKLSKEKLTLWLEKNTDSIT